MKKISKSDQPIDYRPASEQIEAMWAGPKCQHFAVGTGIKIAHMPPAEIIENNDGLLTCRTEDGTVFRVRPVALNPTDKE